VAPQSNVAEYHRLAEPARQTVVSRTTLDARVGLNSDRCALPICSGSPVPESRTPGSSLGQRVTYRPNRPHDRPYQAWRQRLVGRVGPDQDPNSISIRTRRC
jgi:hypothetical protein